MKTKLEELYFIEHNSYTTGSEWLDGLLIGLTTWLLIRSSEFVVLDLLTYFYGDRRHRTGYRVLRIWQILNLFHFYKLFTGFDSDLPATRFRRGGSERGFDRKTMSSLRIKKGRFMPLLVSSVLLGKILVLGAEVAIIAFVIPVATVHRSNGGLGLRWTNATVTEASLKEQSTCEQLLTSDEFNEMAQLVLCKRVSVRELFRPIRPKWIPNGSLRFEQVELTPENMRRAGAVLTDSAWNCRSNADEDKELTKERARFQSVTRQVSVRDEPNIVFSNEMSLGEISISGASILIQDKRFLSGSAAILPVFSDAERTLRLSFADMFSWRDPVDGRPKVLTINGKLMFGFKSGQVSPGLFEGPMCPDAVKEIMGVTGTLHAEMIIDILRSGMTLLATREFTEPSEDMDFLRTTAGFVAGTSRRFRIPPEWMVLAAGLAMLASAFTSRLNKTEASMARVYRENNNMYSACAPSFLEEELVAEGALFQSGNEYHWGKDPGKGWDQVSSFERSEEGTLV